MLTNSRTPCNRAQCGQAELPGTVLPQERQKIAKALPSGTARVMLQRTPAKIDPRKLVTESIAEPRHIRKSEFLAETTADGKPTLTEEYWVDFEVNEKGVMTASVRTVSPDHAYRSGSLRFKEEFGRALEHFGQNGIEVKTFEGDWSYMTAEEISDNLKDFREGMAQGLTRERSAAGTPSGKVATRHSFEITDVENIPKPQPHLADEGVRRWRVKATFQRVPWGNMSGGQPAA